LPCERPLGLVYIVVAVAYNRWMMLRNPRMASARRIAHGALNMHHIHGAGSSIEQYFTSPV
jgi:hypothetical protein